jgi:predicted DNA binding CopG/RHH family protein
MSKRVNGGRFASEADEAAWWAANEERLAEEFEHAPAAGPAIVVITGDSKVTKIHLGEESVLEARKQAAERGLRCQAYLKMILREALRKAERRGKAR